ncbi:ABC transporter ATP-binding protein [Oceanobacillus sp. FSL H7-0719]|uniref:ABC transporter ATP-binding protein n=1 Tax=Oceanobacillus sp. FSL H7-0719 TaxID=2954507 RepID=UPI003246CE1C
MMAAIQIRRLKKRYGDTEVLKNITMDIYPGEIFGFVGHNGAGKSTLIHALTGITHTSSGAFEILGFRDDQIDDAKKEIGVMPDVSNLYENMKGISFLKYMGDLAGSRLSKEDYISLMADVGLEGAEWKKIKSYSFGMKKKISLAQALLGNPRIIILDEPTSGLDPESAIRVRQLILKLKQQGKTILLTSHNLDEIEKISDRVGILADGVIKMIGAPSELKNNEKLIQLKIRTKPMLLEPEIAYLNKQLALEINFSQTKDGYSVVTLRTEEDIPLLSKTLIEADYLIYEIKIEQQSLEDVFLNI